MAQIWAYSQSTIKSLLHKTQLPVQDAIEGPYHEWKNL